MKIINLIQKPQLRGAEIFACQLSNHLEKQGHEVLVVTIYEGDSKLPFKGQVKYLNRKLSNRFFDVIGWRKFHQIIKDFNPDIIQANASDTLKFAASSKYIFSWKQPLIYRNANKMGDFISSKLKWYLNNFYLSKISYVISVSQECEKDFIKTFSFPQSKITTVEIGVEESIIGNIPEDLRETFKKGPVWSHIGGFVPEKNHEGLLRIFKKSLKYNPSIQLLLMGKGSLETKIKLQVEELGIKGRVHFLGYRNDVLEILHHSNLFVLPSLIEGLPAVILEAMYCETAVVAYNVGGISEVVIPETTGWLVDKDDENTMVKYIQEILTGKNKTQIKIRSARNMVQEKFMNERITERFLSIYRKSVL